MFWIFVVKLVYASPDRRVGYFIYNMLIIFKYIQYG